MKLASQIMVTPKKVAIVQSNYIPWKGYFDLINSVDEFILFDDVQYTKRDWRNRNQIKTPNGIQWLTIPVEVKGKFSQSIKDTKTSAPNWGEKHWQTLQANYAKAPFFSEYKEFFRSLYLRQHSDFLSQINFCFLSEICKLLGVQTKLSFSMDYKFEAGDKNGQLIWLCKQSKATEYLSGPKAAGYMDTSLFSAEGIDVKFYDYSGYPEYRQCYPPFAHGVSILDLLFNEGSRASSFMKSFSQPQTGVETTEKLAA